MCDGIFVLGRSSPRHAVMAGAGRHKFQCRLLKQSPTSLLLLLFAGLSHLFFAGGEDFTTVNPFDSTIIQTTMVTGLANGTAVTAAALPQSYRREGDYVLGGLFDLHDSQDGECGNFNPRGLKWMHAMVFAIDQINDRDDILPNITLGEYSLMAP